MAKIVIEIPEEIYEDIKFNRNYLQLNLLQIVCHAIAKGHKLSDDSLYKEACKYAINKIKSKNSSYVAKSSKGAKVVTWDEVIKWLNQ